MAASSTRSDLSAEAIRALAWFQAHYYGGRPPVYSVIEVARGLYQRTDSPVPGMSFEPAAWGRVRQAIDELVQKGLVEHGRLPQGDFGFCLAPAAWVT
ncbi:MAG: hypothetical protein IT307_18335 [Chloroflexi bacterium]|nr:hypothetical protein [Chloroflexota bacterium]